jgi:hypothetical protein
MRNLAFTGQEGQLQCLAEYRRGESDLVHSGGQWSCWRPAKFRNPS